MKRSLRSCDSADVSKLYLGKVQTGDGQCWQHVHPSELNVYDLTDADAAQYTIAADNVVSMSTSFLYGTVEANPSIYTEIGKLDDHIQGGPHPLNTEEVKSAFATFEFNAAEGAVLVCGSPDEVASDVSTCSFLSCRRSILLLTSCCSSTLAYLAIRG